MSSLISSHDYTGPHLEIIKLTRSKVARWRWSSCACKALITASPFLDRLKCSVSSTRREASSTNSPSAPLQGISSRKTPKRSFPSPPAWDGQRLVLSVGRGEVTLLQPVRWRWAHGQNFNPFLPPSLLGLFFCGEGGKYPWCGLCCDTYGVQALSKSYSPPPAKVKYPIPGHGNGIGTIHFINSSGLFCYHFGVESICQFAKASNQYVFTAWSCFAFPLCYGERWWVKRNESTPSPF